MKRELENRLEIHCEPGPLDEEAGTRSIVRVLVALAGLIVVVAGIAWLGTH